MPIIFLRQRATGMALVAIDGNERVFRSYGETRPGNNVRPQLDWSCELLPSPT
ncbi:hypothetical protein ACLK19_02620 [Escherichia coli]